jgi:hypothetical protein
MSMVTEGQRGLCLVYLIIHTWQQRTFLAQTSYTWMMHELTTVNRLFSTGLCDGYRVMAEVLMCKLMTRRQVDSTWQ